MSETVISEFFRPKRFVKRNPDLVTMNQLRWQLRNRHQNGLVAASAVLELRSHADQRRPSLLIDEPRYFIWLREQGKWLRQAFTRMPHVQHDPALSTLGPFIGNRSEAPARKAVLPNLSVLGGQLD